MPDFRAAVRARLASLELDPHQEVDVVEELAQELEERHARALREGSTLAEADDRIRRELGTPAFAAELRAALPAPTPVSPPDAGLAPGRGRVSFGLREDLRYAARLLVKSPLFTLAAVLSLALGVGANTTIFSLVSEVLLNPFPIQDSQRVVPVFTTDAKNKDRCHAFVQMSY